VKEPVTFGETFGLPQFLLVDNGPEFKSLPLAEVLSCLGSGEDRGEDNSSDA